ncbi:MAG: hypothetical protein EOL87_09815 [Spartobacteria bacterium]|nr:hypothetical protein [Spartobacteria bacterium]
MATDDEENIFGLHQGCPVHGDEAMKTCSHCGNEYCGRCFPAIKTCPDCSVEEYDEEDDEFSDEPDYSDVDDLDILLGTDDEFNILLDSDDILPPDDFT